MNRRTLILLFSVVALVAFATTAAAAPTGPGTPTLRWVTTGPTTAEIRADGIENGGGQANNGAISWDIYFRFPNTVPAPYPVITAEAGADWTGLNCGFAASIAPNQPSEPGATGDRGVFLNGSCTSSFPASSVTGSNVLLATLTFGSCPSAGGGFVMDLDSGDDVYGVEVSDMFDRSNDPYYFIDADLTDGAPMCAPTAVELTNVQADSAPETFQYGLLLALAAVAAVVAGAGFAMRRRNSVNS